MAETTWTTDEAFCPICEEEALIEFMGLDADSGWHRYFCHFCEEQWIQPDPREGVDHG
jgi:hypothetical protein